MKYLSILLYFSIHNAIKNIFRIVLSCCLFLPQTYYHRSMVNRYCRIELKVNNISNIL